MHKVLLAICLTLLTLPMIGQVTLQRTNSDSISTDSISTNNRPQEYDPVIEIDGLIINETISKSGNDFYDLFNDKWVWPELEQSSFLILISERPFRGISTQIVIKVNDLTVLTSFLQARYDTIEELAQASVARTRAYIINYQEIMKQLEGEDVKGTGIY